MGPVSVVVPIDKLSLVVTVIFSYFVHENLIRNLYVDLFV